MAGAVGVVRLCDGGCGWFLLQLKLSELAQLETGEQTPPRATTRVSTPPPIHSRPYQNHAPRRGDGVIIVGAGAAQVWGGDPCGRPWWGSVYLPIPTDAGDVGLSSPSVGVRMLAHSY